MTTKTIKALTFDEMHGSFNDDKGILPHFRASEKQIPEIASWPVDGRYTLKIDVIMTDKGDKVGHFDIIAYENLTENIDDPSSPRNVSSSDGNMRL